MRQRKLASQARQLYRSLFSKLPLEIKLGALALKVAFSGDSGKEAFGRWIYGEFIRAGVREMPDVNGTPTVELDLGRNGWMKLPKRYGYDFAKRLYAFGYKQAYKIVKGGHDDAENVLYEAIMDVYEKGQTGKLKLQPVSISEAESYIHRIVYNSIMDVGRKAQRSIQETSMTSEKGGMTDFLDPSSFARSVKGLPRWEAREALEKILKAFRSSNDREIFERRYLDGQAVSEIAEDMGVRSQYISKRMGMYQSVWQKILAPYLEA